MESAVTVMILEDHTELLDSFCAFFKQHGVATLKPYEYPLRALNDIRMGKVRPDVIITDDQMPGMSGLEFLERATDYYPEARGFILATCIEDYREIVKYTVIEKNYSSMRRIMEELLAG